MDTELSAVEALSVVLGELRTVRRELATVHQTVAAQTAEIDRLRIRINDPSAEELTADEAAAVLGMSAYTVKGRARAYERGERGGLRGFKRQGRGGGEWMFLRSDVEAYKKRRRVS